MNRCRRPRRHLNEGYNAAPATIVNSIAIAAAVRRQYFHPEYCSHNGAGAQEVMEERAGKEAQNAKDLWI
jgi:hypothetical protein